MDNLIKQLKTLKDEPVAGLANKSVQASTRASVLEAIQHSGEEPRAYGVRDAVAFYKWNISELVVRPLVVSASVFLIVMGGWLTSVNAASNSLPGDKLYGIKLIAERAQLQLASRDHKAVLHTEFAQKRYQEAVDVQKSNRPDKNQHVEQAMGAFRAQLALASSELQKVGDENGEIGKIAGEVDEGIDSLDALIEETKNQVSEDQNAQGATKEVTQVIVDVLVDGYESSEETVSHEDLSKLFKKTFIEIRDREAFNLGRVAVIEQTVGKYEGDLRDELPTNKELNTLDYSISKLVDDISEAESLFARGAERIGFDKLSEINEGLLSIEQELADTEITIMNVMTAENEVEVVEEDIENDVETESSP